ncbi:hypothetical protein BDV37DRAFT_266170 [Aspergillus pseudonomiae]|uniref:Uncharacterized protein n=1 Tax=Aspergillus pseudonomiae TaxID=1506151 RepID=A0A5N7CUB0_9EURO|nr:uncharacterized protein BDV37DRAFT_266170 [Aspergillus pseudonomiae]KAE8397248.1 hypothetical protein BDV37DRAFT_266170 [Aspergillus pseudonomiae]
MAIDEVYGSEAPEKTWEHVIPGYVVYGFFWCSASKSVPCLILVIRGDLVSSIGFLTPVAFFWIARTRGASQPCLALTFRATWGSRNPITLPAPHADRADVKLEQKTDLSNGVSVTDSDSADVR